MAHGVPLCMLNRLHFNPRLVVGHCGACTMSSYRLISQLVDASLDFEQFVLRGCTRLDVEFFGELELNNGISRLLMLTLPSVGAANYKSVTINGEPVEYKIVIGVNSNFDPKYSCDSLRNVDLLTLDSINGASTHLRESLLYVTMPIALQPRVSLEVLFEYSGLDLLNSYIYMERHWLLPRGKTAYREYRTCTSAPGGGCWFPILLHAHEINETKIDVQVTVPTAYSVVTSLKYDIEASQSNVHTVEPGFKRFCFSSSVASLVGVGGGDLFPFIFDLFAGEFEFWDGQVRSKLEKPDDTLQEDLHASAAPCLSLGSLPMSKLVFFTLKGFGNMLEPTNIAVNMCLDTYHRVMEYGLDQGFCLGFLPVHVQTFDPTNLAANIRTQNYTDIKRCTAYTGCETMLHAGFMDSLTRVYSNLFYRGGPNVVVYPLDVLHTYTDIEHDPGVMEKRIAIAHGIATLYCRPYVLNPARDLHLDLVLQFVLLEHYIRRNFGLAEAQIRAWARREVFATFVEYYGDPYPLCQDDVSEPTSVGLLLQNTNFLLKASLIPVLMEGIFATVPFIPGGFLVQMLKRSINSKWIGPSFWETMSSEIIKRYIISWNARPQNRLVQENQLPLGTRLESIVKRGIEHDQLNIFMTNFQSLVTALVFGTGSLQINQSFALQLQRKGTSMDHLIFRVDLKSLQPPLDVDSKGNTLYSPCSLAGLAGSNLLETYTQLASIMQLDEMKAREHRILNRVCRLMGIVSFDPSDAQETRVGETLDFGDVCDSLGLVAFSEIGQLRKKMAVYQAWHDSVDLVGRDGNFAMGFGYIGAHALQFCLGNGPIWDCLEVFKQYCDVDKIANVLVDNGGSYCGYLRHPNTLSTCLKRLPIASTGGLSYWYMILQQYSNLKQRNTSNSSGNVNGTAPLTNGTTNTDASTCFAMPMQMPQNLSAGFAKQWNFSLKIEIVEDDGVREHVKRVGDLVPCSYKVNPRAERGRKKVANKAVPATASAIKNDQDDDPSLEDGRKSCYVGIKSDSDRMLIEWLKLLYIGMHPEMAQLDNRSVVARVCSKLRLPILWLRADPGFCVLGRIRRCQSGSMWEQQLHSDNLPMCQFEAAFMLGQFGKSESFTRTENPIAELATRRLEQAIKRHRIHPSVRHASLYSLASLHNRDFRLAPKIQAIFEDYYQSFCTSAKNWHPSEARFMMQYYRGLGLLRNKHGYTPLWVLSLFCKFLELINGPNYAVHAIGIVEAISYINLDPSTSLLNPKHEASVHVKRIWLLLWHLFRLDAIPGDGTHDHSLTATFLKCIARQLVLLKLCDLKFKSEKDLGFHFDFLAFLPLTQHKCARVVALKELNHVYYSARVHKAAIWSAFTIVLAGAYEPISKTLPQLEHEAIYLVPVDHWKRLEYISKGRNIYHTIYIATRLHRRLESFLLSTLWDAFYDAITEAIQLHPLAFMATFGEYLEPSRRMLFDVLKPCCVASKSFAKQLYAKISRTFALIYGHGKILPQDPEPSQELVQGYLALLSKGSSMPKIASFKRLYGDCDVAPTTDWQQVAQEAVGALKELPQAKWYLGDPEKWLPGYKALVRQPMWLNRIEHKAKHRMYRLPMEYKADFILIIKNAKAVNKADTVYYKDATILQEQFDTLWPAIVKVYQKNAKAAATTTVTTAAAATSNVTNTTAGAVNSNSSNNN